MNAGSREIDTHGGAPRHTPGRPESRPLLPVDVRGRPVLVPAEPLDELGLHRVCGIARRGREAGDRGARAGDLPTRGGSGTRLTISDILLAGVQKREAIWHGG